jgi:DnaJ-class molecular chaperone
MRRLAQVAVVLLATFVAAVLPGAQGTDNPHGAIKEPCASCHQAKAWKPAQVSASFRHAPGTFPLEGAHARATCLSCHRTLDFKQTPAGCASCHTDVHSGELGTTCARCHSARSFVDASRMRRAHELTRLPLRGAHAAATCESCHQPGVSGRLQFTNRPVTCFGCHGDQFRAVRTPDHRTAAFTQDCASCHGVSTWRGGRFDHSTTRFALDGAHRAVSCAGCHGDRVFAGKPTSCVSCHQAKYTATTNPPHAASGFPTTCETCHTATVWTGAVFNHATTRFPLTGSHLAASCQSCHADGVYHGKPMTCVSCHQAKYTATTNPPHAAAAFPTTCETCHTTAQWLGALFDHAATRFPLVGAHKTALCSSCHADGVYHGKPTTCVSCHQANYAATTSPAHAAAGFSTTCETCHTATTWTGAVFNHANTRFPLTGAHLAATCRDCHADGVYSTKPTTCVSCHLANYAASVNPPHVAAGFPTTCELCHTATVWTGAVFNHSATRFPLTGAHVNQPCSACHGDGVYRGKTLVCSGCHLAKYTATTNPSHTAALFPTTCESCHTTATWLGATFDHDSKFPIYSGKHLGRWRVCADCHTTPTNFALFSCASCHTKTQMDSKHQGRTGYVFDPIACYTCHPRGSA